MNMVKFLNEIKEPKVSELGGKGYSLAVLINNGFNIPRGFVITSEAFFKFLKENKLMEIIEKLTSEINENNFQERSKEIRELILKGKVPEEIVLEIEETLNKLNVEYVSIRSSAVSEDSLKASFAGLHDTFLNVKAELESVLENVKKCWASLFNDRAVIYRIRKKIPHLEGMAVVMQEMIDAEVSGITFTVHPTNRNALLIEYAAGVGENIVSGKIIPKSIIIEKTSLRVLEKNDVGGNISLSETTIKELASKCLKIEKVFNKPQDIEWLIQSDELYILQSRYITTKFFNHNRIKEIRSIKGLGASPGVAKGRVKVIHNIQQLHKIKEGDILVATMTNPDMVLAMSKCTGIITDSGGMICHAAIISRELDIPCVVGTRIATQVLKEGMIAEMDGTKGIVNIIEIPAQTPIDNSEKERLEYFTIFGNKVKPIKLKIIRKQPLWPKIWNLPWPPIDFDEYLWICPRPEIYGSFVQRSLISAGIEQIPYSLGFEDLGPLYVRYYDNVYIHFEKTKEILERLRQKLLEADTEFWENFTKQLKHMYEKFNRNTEEIRKRIEENLSIDELVEIFEEWWKVHNEFFSTTYLIQSMGDDTIWPAISGTLENILRDKDRVLEYVKILSAPITEKEIVTSTKFALETLALIEYDEVIKKLIESNLDESTVLEVIKKLDRGKEWIKKLKKHVQEWSWVRERDLYFDPILDEIGMIKFIKRYAPKKTIQIDLQKNKELFLKVMSELKQKPTSELFKKLRFYIEVGRILHKERDDHHYIWIKNTSVIRKIILIFGEELYKSGIIEDKKDVFFLTLPEILFLLEKPSLTEHDIIITRSKIIKRMAHLKKMIKVEFHKRIDEKLAPQYFDDIF